MKTQLLFLLLIIPLFTNAQITTDGSLGPSLNLLGPDYQIGPDLGQQRGRNLFHSFQEFNLNSAESATFSGPNHIQNVISRVTGGNPSQIDGLFRSTIPGADVYFLNPYGIVFGENAQLDVQGSFHASTADYLRLGDGGHFDARNPSGSILTVAPIESFGFLDNPHGSIQVNGRGVLNESENPRALLQVPEGKDLSLIGGEIYLSQSVDDLPLEGLVEGNPEEIQAAQYRDQRFSQLYAPGGTLNLVSIQRAGEIALTKNGLNSTATQGGTLQLEQEAFISTTGESGGNVFIRAGRFSMDNSTIYARTLGTQDGGVVDIQANNIELINWSKIRGGTENTGDGTDINLSASETIRLSNNSPLNTYAGDVPNPNQPVGNAGYISLQAKDISIENVFYNNGMFSSSTHGTGQGGDIRLSAENHLNIVDNSHIQTNTSGDDALAGTAGNIYLEANALNVESSAIGTTSSGHANAGQLVIKVGQLYVGKINAHGGGSTLQTISGGQGHSGKITIQADDIRLEDGAYIASSNFGNGKTGDINIQARNQLIIRGADGDGYATGIYSSSETRSENTQAGDAGNIHIRAQEIRLEAGGRIDAGSKIHLPVPTASSGQAGNIVLEIKGDLILSGVNPYGENVDGFGSVISSRSQGNTGNAGNIQIQANSVSILDGALIETGSDNQSHGGNIQIQAGDYIIISGDASQVLLNDPAWSQLQHLSKSNLQTYNQSNSGIYAHSTSRAVNSGDSGHIELSTSQLTLSNQGQISTASQGGGNAGKITLNVGTLVLSDNALIRSNSDLVNQWTFDSVTARDNHIINLGTVVKTQDIGDGKAIYQINLGNTLVNFMPITHVADMTALEHITEQLLLKGEMVIVEDTGHGQSTRLIYVASSITKETWTRINEDSLVILEHADFPLNNVVIFVDGIQPPYQNGTPIHVKDIGNGKAGDFIYTVKTPIDHSEEWIRGEAYRVKYYQVADTAALQDLTTSTDLLLGTQVDVSRSENDNPARFVFDGNGWVRFGPVQEVPNVKAQQNLILAKPGHIANLPTGNTIYTGNEWINLGQIYRVNNLAERNGLNVQHGDLVKVADVGNGRYDAFLYADGQWIRQIRGGDAGQIVINADTIQLSNGSKISTGSISGGGGSVTLNVDKLVYLTDSQISTSVQEGAGSGGDLTINGSQFVIMNNGKIIAQAYEGNGGNIRLSSKQLVKSPCSQISASSRLGLDGEVQIDSPAVDLDAMLVVLPGAQLEAKLTTCNIAEELDNPTYTFQVKKRHRSYPLMK